MDNYFSVLNGINVNDKTEKKNGLTYLSWAWAWGEVKKLFPDATYAEQIIKTEAYRMEKRFADGVKGLHVYGAKVTNGNEIAKLICSIA